MNLAKPTPHELKSVIKKHNISVASIAQFMDLSYPYVNHLLNGSTRMTPENELKFQEIINHLEGNGGKRTE